MTPPRTLKAPVGRWFSCLTQTSVPARAERSGHAICGVGPRLAWTRSAASAILPLAGFNALIPPILELPGWESLDQKPRTRARRQAAFMDETLSRDIIAAVDAGFDAQVKLTADVTALPSTRGQ